MEKGNVKEAKSIFEIFKIYFKQINSKAVIKQLEKLRKEQSEVVAAYTLTWLYANFLERAYKVASRRELAYKPLPDGPDGGLIKWPPDLRYKSIQEQLDEWLEATNEFLREQYREVVKPERTCVDIKKDYNTAKACVTKYLNTPPQTEEEWNEYNKCLDDLKKYANQMEEHNCKFDQKVEWCRYKVTQKRKTVLIKKNERKENIF